jgi:hypothetical protein
MSQLYTPAGIDAKLDAVPSQSESIDAKMPYQPVTPHPNRFRSGFGRGLAAALTIGLVYLVTACAGMQTKPDFYPEKGAPHTITYIKDGKEVTAFDLNGKWETKYAARKEIIDIRQTENRFVGYKTIGDDVIPQGGLTISGGIEGNIVACDTHMTDRTTRPFTSKLSKNVDSFECAGSQVREYKRIE